MQETLTISKGNQYDRDGYYLESDRSSAPYAFGRLDGDRVTFDGRWFRPECLDEVTAVIRQVLATGETQVITVGEPSSLPLYVYEPEPIYPGSRDDCE